MGIERKHVMERPVSYYSEGARLSAVLYVPDGASPASRRPGIVLCHGFTGIKELILPDYARRLAAAGYVVPGLRLPRFW